jgi:hypothetical protein
MNRFDVCVQGAGTVGQSLALSLARQGLQVALVSDAKGSAREDVRAYALNAASVELLRGLKVWDALPPHAATAVYDMHIEGDNPVGVLEFSAWQQHASELAWITDAAVLEQSLASAIRFAPHVTVTSSPVEATLTALCEGKNSASRPSGSTATPRASGSASPTCWPCCPSIRRNPNTPLRWCGHCPKRVRKN